MKSKDDKFGGFGRDQNAFGSGQLSSHAPSLWDPWLLVSASPSSSFLSLFSVDQLYLLLRAWLPHNSQCHLSSAYVTKRPWLCTSSPSSGSENVIDSAQLRSATPVVTPVWEVGQLGSNMALGGYDCEEGSVSKHSLLSILLNTDSQRS